MQKTYGCTEIFILHTPHTQRAQGTEPYSETFFIRKKIRCGKPGGFSEKEPGDNGYSAERNWTGKGSCDKFPANGTS